MIGPASPERASRLPPWFKIRSLPNAEAMKVRQIVNRNGLHTVCRSAACPNQAECWNRGTATFMILGNICTRGCGFCNVPKGIPQGADIKEPGRVAAAVASLGLRYAVVTSVTRDDLPDGGASLFAATIRAIRTNTPACHVEVLIPDFQGSPDALASVLAAKPDVLNHNIETVPSRYAVVRPKADYERSLALLRSAKQQGATTKSGLMLGLGEGRDEIIEVLRDLCDNGCDILTLGQYLRPSRNHLPVDRFYHPDEFELLREHALGLGFKSVLSGPLVRSSYHADEQHPVTLTSRESYPE